MQRGAFCWSDPLLVEQRGTANQYKVVLRDHRYPGMNDFYLDGNGPFQDDNAVTHEA